MLVKCAILECLDWKHCSLARYDPLPQKKKRNRIMYREAPTGSHVREPPSAAYIIYARARIEAL